MCIFYDIIMTSFSITDCHWQPQSPYIDVCCVCGGFMYTAVLVCDQYALHVSLVEVSLEYCRVTHTHTHTHIHTRSPNKASHTL